MKRTQIITAARSYLGVPYHHQGRSHHGLDCAGLILCLAKDLGIVPPDYDYNAYAREPDGVSLVAEIERWCTPTNDWQPGDLLVFKIKVNPRHLAIATRIESLNAFGMIHALQSAQGKGQVTEHILDDWWRSRIVQAYRLPGVES